jgi:hypothetical protein
LIGACAALEISTASRTKSGMMRRPKPPPSSVMFSRMASRGRPVSFITSMAAQPGVCVGAQIVQRSFSTCAVALIGSIGACAWNGAS